MRASERASERVVVAGTVIEGVGWRRRRQEEGGELAIERVGGSWCVHAAHTRLSGGVF